MSIIERRVQRLEEQRGARAGQHCAVCDDGARPSGLVFRVAGDSAAREHSHPACAGCGRCSPLVFDIVIADSPAAA